MSKTQISNPVLLTYYLLQACWFFAVFPPKKKYIYILLDKQYKLKIIKFNNKKLFLSSKGSYRCGGCRSGYIGNQTLGCLSVDNLKKTPWMCPDGTMCHPSAECVRSTTGKFSCEVSWTIAQNVLLLYFGCNNCVKYYE